MYLWGVSTVSGVLLVAVGVMIYANTLTMITSFLEQHGIGWYLGPVIFQNLKTPSMLTAQPWRAKTRLFPGFVPASKASST